MTYVDIGAFRGQFEHRFAFGGRKLVLEVQLVNRYVILASVVL